MNLLAPLALALGVVIPILILFYLLKVRRTEFEVGSTYLWQDLLRDLAAHEPWQRFHWSILLILQLVLVADDQFTLRAVLARLALDVRPPAFDGDE